MRALFLFSGSRVGLMEKIKTGEYHGDGFWGMIQLPKYGVDAEYIEVEQTYSKRTSAWMRRHINNYAIHIPIFGKLFSYDIVFTSAAFATQLLFALIHPKKPLWVMHDFSIKSLLGNEKTLRQKIFRFMVRRAAGVVTLSVDEKEFLETRFPHLRGRVEFIPFGVDLEYFRPLDIPQKRQVLAVGFDPDRDWKTLVRAIDGIDADVVLATREQRVARLRPLPQNVSVKQFSPRELVRAYAESSVVVVPLDTSHGTNDAMGCSTLFEGMAMGKAVVATRTKATESYVKDGENAILVKEGDATELRVAIGSLLADETLRKSLGANAREYASKDLDIEKRSAELAAFFKRLSSLS